MKSVSVLFENRNVIHIRFSNNQSTFTLQTYSVQKLSRDQRLITDISLL